MAVGLGHLFGLRLPQNFNSPYKAVNVADFWHRWHISLSSCLRDYLYIPLGGSRGSRWEVYRNLMITMLLGGLWHGANWTFVVWGGYHGLLLILHRIGSRPWERLPVALQRTGTFFLVTVGWVFFRSQTFGMAASLLHSMFRCHAGVSLPWQPGLLIMLAIAAIIAHSTPNTFDVRHEWNPWLSLAMAGLFAACVLAIYSGQESPFLYFQF
jgi:alginate O-acetyltransferase complex protein AlgI